MNLDPVIILGYKRSGTSLLRVILNSHPDIAIGPEIKFMQRVVKKYPQTFEEFLQIAKREVEDFGYSESTLRKIFENSFSAAELMKNWCDEYRIESNKQIWGDKTPQSFKYLKLISEKFPEALYVHIVRHPFEVMRSSKKRGQYHGIHTILGWVMSNVNIRYVKHKNYLFIRYEDFIQDPDKHIRIILSKLGKEYVDLISTYQNYNHGRLAEGDSWNKPILKTQVKKKEILSTLDKFLIRILCLRYFYKYGYTAN